MPGASLTSDPRLASAKEPTMRLITQAREGIPNDLTVCVGQQDAPICGKTDRALQAGLDYLARLGGGTLKIGPGIYTMRNSIHLQSRIRIVGAGDDTVLRKGPSARTKLVEDSDWYYQSVKVESPETFEIGDGIVLQAKPPNSNFQCRRFTITGIDGQTLFLEKQLVDNFWIDQEASCASLFPIICGEEVTDIEIRDLVIEGNREENENINGNYAAGIFMQNCDRINIDSIAVQNYNGDGISWQIVHDLSVTNSRSINNAGLGLHPGSGSQRPQMRGNQIERCHLGIFFCWGVKHGIAEQNQISDCDIGVSIGHRDTDNIVRENIINGCSKHGLLFRNESHDRNGHRNGHRNRIEKNQFLDCGTLEDGCVIHISGPTDDITFKDNQFSETREGAKVKAIVAAAETNGLVLEGNQYSGLEAPDDHD